MTSSRLGWGLNSTHLLDMTCCTLLYTCTSFVKGSSLRVGKGKRRAGVRTEMFPHASISTVHRKKQDLRTSYPKLVIVFFPCSKQAGEWVSVASQSADSSFLLLFFVSSSVGDLSFHIDSTSTLVGKGTRTLFRPCVFTWTEQYEVFSSSTTLRSDTFPMMPWNAYQQATKYSMGSWRRKDGRVCERRYELPCLSDAFRSSSWLPCYFCFARQRGR